MQEVDPVYSIGEVSDLLGVPAPTIRSWERRYGLEPQGHTNAGHRRYDAGDLTRLQRMRDELADGRTGPEAAATARALVSTTPALLAGTICTAAHRLDDATITDALEQARTLHGLAAAVDLVLLPVMRELGRQWAAGQCDVAHEHLATTTAQTWLRNLRPARPLCPSARPVLLACGPDEQHTLPLDALGVLLAQAGQRCLHLGARVPAASLRVAANDSQARAIVLTSQLTSHRAGAIAALHQAEGTPATLYYAGAAFADKEARQAIPGRYLGTNLEHATSQILATN